MITINLENEQNANVLKDMINIALKDKGIEAAQAALYFTALINQAVAKYNEEKVEKSKLAE